MADLTTQLSKVIIFRGLNKKQLKSLLRISTKVQFEKDAVIFEEGDRGEELYLILDGKIRISRDLPGGREEALAILEDSHGFGEMSVIEDSVVRSATARAHEACSLLVFRKEPFQQLLRDDRDLAYTVLWNVVKQFSGRLRATTDKMMLFLSASGMF